jgi:hypothetical protein
LSPGHATIRFGTVSLYTGRDGTGEDGQLLRGANPLPEQLDLAVHLIETTLCGRELGTQFFGLPPQTPEPPAQVPT